VARPPTTVAPRRHSRGWSTGAVSARDPVSVSVACLATGSDSPSSSVADGQAGRAQQPDVGRYRVAAGELDHVARDELVGGQFPGDRRDCGSGAAQHRRGRRGQAAQGRRGTTRPVLLADPQPAGDRRQYRDDRHRGRVAADRGHHAHQQQYHHERVGQRPREVPARRRGQQHVLPAGGQPPLRLALVQAVQ